MRLGLTVFHRGSRITDGHTAGVGDPHSLDMMSNCIKSAPPCIKQYIIVNRNLCGSVGKDFVYDACGSDWSENFLIFHITYDMLLSDYIVEV